MASIANANPTITIPRIDASSLSGSFHIEATYVLQNLPVILFNAGVEQWRAWKDWRSHGDDKSHHINFEHLDSNFGQVTAPVTNCKSGHSIVLSVTNFLSAWKEAATSSKSPPLRYMKDWHLVRDFPDYQGYEIPKPYVTDWLNDWWTDPLGRALWAEEQQREHSNNDYRFCYMGCKGTWTGLHHDVMCSFSWSANVIGRKLWRLFPPTETHKLYHHRIKDQLVLDSRDGMYDAHDFPNVSSAKFIDVVQEEGEIMFVPSGWHHQVHNLDDCISVNHNWLNGCCIERVWDYVQGRWHATKSVIEHLENEMDEIEFAQCCSKIMGADIGLTPEEFIAMLKFWKERLEKRMEHYTKEADEEEDDEEKEDAAELHDGSLERLNGVIEACKLEWSMLYR